MCFLYFKISIYVKKFNQYKSISIQEQNSHISSFAPVAYLGGKGYTHFGIIFPDLFPFVYTYKLFVFTNSAFSRTYIKLLTKDSSLVEMNKLPIHTVIRMSIKNSMLSEKSLKQTSTYYIIPFMWSSRTGQIESMMRKKIRIEFPSIWVRQGLPGKKHDRTLQGDANVFYILKGAWDSQMHAFVKTRWMHS